LAKGKNATNEHNKDNARDCSEQLWHYSSFSQPDRSVASFMPEGILTRCAPLWNTVELLLQECCRLSLCASTNVAGMEIDLLPSDVRSQPNRSFVK
jgi:hypothetical protein